jgi:hypothetical protein
MDAEYSAPYLESQSKGGRTKITRKAYMRRKPGAKTKTVKVPATRIRDVGALGRWQSVTGMKGIGPLKKGELKAVGYDATASAPARHAALDKAVKKYGRLSTLRKLNAIAVYTKRTVPSRSRTYKTDRNYVKKSYF